MKVNNKAWICSLLICGTLIGIRKEIKKQKEKPTYNEKQIENFIKYYNTFEHNDINRYELNTDEINLPEVDIDELYSSDEYIYIDGIFIRKEDFNEYMNEKIKQKIR